jgi:hypothetical protein
MTQQIDRKYLGVPALVALGLLGLGAAAYYVNKNYDVRLVRVDADASNLAAAEGPEGLAGTAESARSTTPAPVIVRLACTNPGSAMSSLRSPSRSLRRQLQQADPKAPAPLPGMRCKQTAGL